MVVAPPIPVSGVSEDAEDADEAPNAYDLATAHPPGMYELATAHPPGMYELDSEQHGGETDDSAGFHLQHSDDDDDDAGHTTQPGGYLDIESDDAGSSDQVLVLSTNDNEGDA